MDTKDFFSFKGRIRRSTFGIRLVAFFIIFLIVYFLLITVGVMFEVIAPENILVLGVVLLVYILVLVMLIIMLIAYIIQAVKRLHDLDRDGIWAILLFIPIVSPIFLLFLIFADGTIGPNRHGEDPKGRTPYFMTQGNMQQ